MKNILASIFISGMLIFNINANAQFTYENKYTIQFGMEGLFLTNIGNFNLKYVIYDYWHDQFSLYNIDHTPFMLNIPLGVSSDSGHTYTIGYITNSLFDCDSTTLEYAIDLLHKYECKDIKSKILKTKKMWT